MSLRILLDSHAYVWFVTGNPRCSAAARAAIEAAGRDTHVSAVTAFELSTKVRLGKWPEAENAARDINETISALYLTPLSISIEHARLAGALTGTRKDPFDRLLAAQAKLESLVLVTADPAFGQFGTRTLW